MIDLESLELLEEKLAANFYAIVKRSLKDVESDLDKGKLKVYIILYEVLMTEVERYLDYELDTIIINYEDK